MQQEEVKRSRNFKKQISKFKFSLKSIRQGAQSGVRGPKLAPRAI